MRFSFIMVQAATCGSCARNELQHALLPGEIPQMCGMVEMCRCAFSTFCEMHCPNQLGMFKLLGKHYNIVLFVCAMKQPAANPATQWNLL